MRSRQPARLGAGFLLAVALGVLALLTFGATASFASKGQWSIFEDHPFLVQTDPQTRAATLDEVEQLGADTVRVEVKWNEVAPSSSSSSKPSFETTNPSAYPGFAPYDAIITAVTQRGLRILLTITGDAPRWATSGARGGNYKPSASEYASFVRAVAKRYSGTFSGLPKVTYFTIWNEPNHIQFIKPTSQAPRVYRTLVDAGIPALRASAAPGSKVFVGELKPTPRKGFGPLKFLQQWLCLDKDFKKLRGKAARKLGCTKFKRIKADGFAHHPYGPVGEVSVRQDIVNLLAIRRLASALDKAARAKRINGGLAIYNTEYGIQTNPPDIFVSTTPTRQAQLLNEKEEYAYRYARLKSHSQYQLYDDPARPGPPAVKWSGFQTGLRAANGNRKPSWDAYRFPIVVKKPKRGSKVTIWGRVRPGTGIRAVQLQKRSGGSYTNVGGRRNTNSQGYFSTKGGSGIYRFAAYTKQPDGSFLEIGTSRAASPTKSK